MQPWTQTAWFLAPPDAVDLRLRPEASLGPDPPRDLAERGVVRRPTSTLRPGPGVQELVETPPISVGPLGTRLGSMKGSESGTCRSGASTALGAKCSSPSARRQVRLGPHHSPLHRHRWRHVGPCHPRPYWPVVRQLHHSTSGVSCPSQPGRWLDMGVTSTVPTSPREHLSMPDDSAPLNLSASDASSASSPDR